MDILGAALPFIGQFNEREDQRMFTQEARQWQEDMYNKYNSPAALVRQYSQAGINPALMFGGQTPSAPTDTSIPSAPANPVGSVTDMLAQLMGIDLLEENREKIRNESKLAAASADKESAQAENVRTDTLGKRVDLEFKPRLLEQQLQSGEVQIENLRAGIRESQARVADLLGQTPNREEERRLMQTQQQLNIANEILSREQGEYVDAQTVNQEFVNRVQDETGSKPGTTLFGLLPGLTHKAIEREQNRTPYHGTPHTPPGFRGR